MISALWIMLDWYWCVVFGRQKNYNHLCQCRRDHRWRETYLFQQRFHTKPGFAWRRNLLSKLMRVFLFSVYCYENQYLHDICVCLYTLLPLHYMDNIWLIFLYTVPYSGDTVRYYSEDNVVYQVFVADGLFVYQVFCALWWLIICILISGRGSL